MHQNIKKHSFFMVVLTILCLLGMPFQVQAETFSGSCGTTATWTFDSATGTLTISGSGTVTDKEGFSEHMDSITSIVINEGITEIATYDCFNNFKALSSVSLPDSLTTISDYAFFDCDSLETVTIPKNLKNAQLAFSESGLTTVTFADGMTIIPHSIFQGCKNLTTVHFASTITEIGFSAFENCPSLTTVTLPPNLIQIGDYTFKETGIKSITIPKTVKNAQLVFNDEILTSIVFENGITEIPHSICSGCTNLTTVTIPDSVTAIGFSAFENCTSLTSITLPPALTQIGDYTFSGCTNLKTITIPKTVTNAQLPFDHSYIESIVFENGCQKIPYCICKGANTLKKITIPDTVTTIESAAFEDCTSVTEITIPASVSTIEYNAFENSGLKTIYGYTDSYAQSYANANGFTFCALDTGSSKDDTPQPEAPKKGSTHKISKSNLKVKITNASPNGKGTVSVIGLIEKASSVTIPKTVTINDYTYKVTEIGKKAFNKQSKLKKIKIKSTTIKKVGKKAFSGIHKKATITVPKAKKSAYKKFIKKSGISQTIKIK